MENAIPTIELGNEKAAHLRDHEARSDEIPSVVCSACKRLKEKVPQETEKHANLKYDQE